MLGNQQHYDVGSLTSVSPLNSVSNPALVGLFPPPEGASAEKSDVSDENVGPCGEEQSPSYPSRILGIFVPTSIRLWTYSKWLLSSACISWQICEQLKVSTQHETSGEIYASTPCMSRYLCLSFHLVQQMSMVCQSLLNKLSSQLGIGSRK